MHAAALVEVPKGRHLGPYAIGWLQNAAGIALPPNFLHTETNQEKDINGRKFQCVRDEGITDGVNQPGIVGFTAVHQLMERPGCSDPYLYRRWIAILQARHALVVREEEHDMMCELLQSHDPADQIRLHGCSENRTTAATMLATSGIEMSVDAVPPGSSEAWLGRRMPQDPWNAAIVITSSGHTLQEFGLQEVEIPYYSPPVCLAAIWRGRTPDGENFYHPDM